MRFSSRSDADADVIRARLRAMLEERPVRGWVPDIDDPPTDEALAGPGARAPRTTGARPDDASPDPTAGPRSRDLPEGLGRHRAPGRTARWDPGRSGARALWVAGLLAALLLIGWTWLDRPRVHEAPPEPDGVPGVATGTPTPTVGEAAGASAVVVASVVGLVARPGLVTLPAGARVADAVAAAGGLLPGADPASVNLAAPVPDGAQIAVGIPDGAVGPDGGGTVTGPGAGSAPGGRVDLNTATAADLDALPGIGPVLAQRIVDHRGRHGPFRTVEQLDDVPGIGPAIAAELSDLVRV